MSVIEIICVKNGYVVREGRGSYDPGIARLIHDDYVFPSFAALTEWLGANLKHPDAGVTRK